jgi:ADP-ribose pyrophosphatase YjhB (NUDIX family)/DNA-binding XRE family transcriptional regulator
VNRIRQIRLALLEKYPYAFTMEEVARRVGVATATYRTWEQGRFRPRRRAAERLARDLGVSVEELQLETPAEHRAADEKARAADGRPVMTAAIIPHPAGRAEVLMTGRVRASVRVWSWVGGHVHTGEDPAEAVIREVTEELEVDGPRVVRLLGTVDTHIDASPWWGYRFARGYVSYNFLVTMESPRVEVIDHEELTSAAWLTVDEVAEALSSLPPELAEPAVRFARQAIAHPAAATPAEE